MNNNNIEKTKNQNIINKSVNKIKGDAFQKDIQEYISTLLLVIVTVMPFIVIKYGERYYVDAKSIILYSSAIIIFALLLLTSNIKITLEIKLSLVFLATICVSTIFSNYSNVALWGSTERKEGCAMFFVYIVLFISAASFFRITQKNLYVILSAGSIMSIYTVIQMFGIDPIQMKLYKKIVTPNTSIATIGNSNFVSSYLCMFLIIAVALYIYKNKKIYLGFSAILFLGFLGARTRGGWIAFAIVCFIGLFFIIKDKKKLIRAAILILTFTVLTMMLNYFTDNKIFDRAKISNIFVKTQEVDNSKETEIQNDDSEAKNETDVSKNDSNNNEEEKTSVNEQNIQTDDNSQIKLLGSASSRTNILRITWKAFCDSPLLGEGPDTLGYRLKKDYPDDYYGHAKEYNEGIDKAHNEYLEYATSEGIFTLISYLALIIIILVKLIKNRKEENNVILFFGILVYVIQAFFNISVIMVAPLFWILLGYAVKNSNKSELIV